MTRDGADALGHAAATAHWLSAGDNIRNTSSPHWRGWLEAGEPLLGKAS